MADPRYVARPVSFLQTNARVKGGTMSGEEFVTHEVVDIARKPLSRVICRTNRADAMMIVKALNATVRDTLTNDKGETLTETMNRVRALPR